METAGIKEGNNMTNTKNTIFSFFSGSGFLDLGFELNGFQINLVNEFQPSFMAAYQYSRSKMGISKPRYGYFNIDINNFLVERRAELHKYLTAEKQQGNLIGFIGGPPCPDFSIAGKNRGRDGDNGKLSQSYINLIVEMQPDFFLFENVKGLWKTALHRAFFDELKEQLHNAGYSTTDRLTNALEFGAPQDRDRILMFGIKNGLLSSPDQINSFPWDGYRKYSVEKIKSLPWPQTDTFVEDSKTICPKGVLEDFTVEHWFRKNDVENHANSRDYFQPRGGLYRMETVQEGDVSKKSYKRLHRWRYSPTVAYGNNEVHLHPYKVRRISAAEALALQTLPKEFELPANMTLTDKFKTIGNGVPFLLSSGVAKTIKQFLNDLD
jgi:DNA (cytosine-5)-methyltransferase 1